MKNKIKQFFIVSTIPLLLVGCSYFTDTEDGGNNGNDSEDVVQENVTISNVEVDVTSGITEAVEKIDGAVVSIINLRENSFNPWAAYYGAEQSDEEYTQAGSGSGAVYKIEGDRAYIFTNNHVVDGSDAIEVLLQDGTRIPAEVEGADVWTDLAVLSIDSANVDVVVEFGNSESLTVGEPAIAIGSPLGTEFASSVTSGIISGISRTVPVDTNNDGEYDWEMTAIQTDAAINPGNSGGPLINIVGQVVGINSMKISSDTVEGMGFAIPSNDAVDIINQLEQNGEVVRPYLGITMADLAYISSDQRESELNLPEDVTDGVVITQVGNNSPAADAELEPGDVIVGFDGETVENSVRLRQLIYTSSIGNEVEVEYYRNGEQNVTTMEMRAASN